MAMIYRNRRTRYNCTITFTDSECFFNDTKADNVVNEIMEICRKYEFPLDSIIKIENEKNDDWTENDEEKMRLSREEAFPFIKKESKRLNGIIDSNAFSRIKC